MMRTPTYQRGWLKRTLAAGVIGAATVAAPIAASAEVGGYAEPDTSTTTEDATLPVVIDVLGNDAPGAQIVPFADSGTPVATFGIVSEVVTGGVVTALTYMPDADMNGVDTFEYQIQIEVEGELVTETEMVEITVTAVPDAPTASADEVGQGGEIVEDGVFELSATLLENDFDVDGDNVSIVSVDDSGSAGTAWFDEPTKTVWYQATSHTATTDTFTYTIRDDSADELEATATVTVIIEPVDDLPWPGDPIEVAVDEGTSTSVDVIALAVDADGGPAFVDSIENIDGIGSVEIDEETGEIVFSAPDELAEVAYNLVSYTLNSDQSSLILFMINPVDDAPVAIADMAEVDEDGSVLIDVLENDTDVDAGLLEVIATTDPTVGSLVVEDDQITYTHEGDSLDDVTFSYTVNGDSQAEVTVSVNNADDDAPVVSDLTGDNAVEIAEDADPVVIGLFEAGAVDVDGDVLSIGSIVVEPTLGSVELIEGDLVYTPNANEYGDDSFSVIVTDNNADVDNDVTVQVEVSITAVNDAPVANNDSFYDTVVYPYYYDDYYYFEDFYTENIVVVEDETTNLYLLDNDSDIDGPELSVVLSSIEVYPEEAGSVASDGYGDVSFTPAPNYFGYVSFEYTVTDGEIDSDPASVEIYVVNTSDAPVAVSDEAQVDEDDVVYVDVLVNDYDDDFDDFDFIEFDFAGASLYGYGESLEIIEVSQPDGGYAVIAGDEIRVEPNPNFVGTLEIEYRVRAPFEPYWDPYSGSTIIDCDSPFGPFGPGGFDGPVVRFAGLDEFDDSSACVSSIGTLTVEVGEVNDAPEAQNDLATTLEDESVTIDVLDNDEDIDSDDLSIWQVGSASKGETSIVDGEVLYTPNADEYGDDAFVYYVTDGEQTDIATVNVEIESVNDVPTIADVNLEIDEDDEATFSLEMADVEDDVDDLAFGVEESPAVGDLDFDGSTVTYTPPQDFFGEVTMSFFVEDLDGAVETNSVTIEVLSVNDDPTVDDVTDTIDEDGESSFTLNMFDVEDGAALTVALGTAPANGDVAIDGANITYTPAENANGDVSFTLVVSDSDGGVATASVDITINPVNDKPTASDMTIEVDEDDSVTFNLVVQEPDGDPLTLSLVDAPALLGDVTFDGTEITWSPSTNFAGSMDFEVRVDDGTGLSVIVDIFGTVKGVNDIPVIEATSASVDEDGSVVVDIDASDIDGFPVSIAVVDGPANGSTEVDGLSVTYVPTADFFGSDSFEVEVTDSADTTAQATVSITVDPTQDAPVAEDCGPFTVEAGQSVDIAVTDCGSDVDGDALTIVADSVEVSTGSVLFSNEDISFTAPETAGDATLTFTISDGNGGTADVAVDITIEAVSSPFLGATGLDGEVVRVYSAMLGREPDLSGFDFWVEQRTDGMTFEQMVDRFADSPEFKSIYGDMIREATDEEWVEFVYLELMDRQPEEIGQDFWLGALESGRFSRSAMVIFFAQSPEYRELTGTN